MNVQFHYTNDVPSLGSGNPCRFELPKCFWFWIFLLTLCSLHLPKQWYTFPNRIFVSSAAPSLALSDPFDMVLLLSPNVSSSLPVSNNCFNSLALDSPTFKHFFDNYVFLPPISPISMGSLTMTNFFNISIFVSFCLIKISSSSQPFLWVLNISILQI